jgi:alpha-glutamyl/putrescinyl thymine pyrophosphorylase clade 1
VKRPPLPRPRIYDQYWHFAAERQQIFQRRLAGEPGPWTDDPILREYKFCNVYRAADRVSQYMIRDVCYHDEPCADEDRVFQIVAFRTFSKTATWHAVHDALGRYPTLEDLADGSFTSGLDQARLRNGGLYTGAFILCANDAYGQSAKHRNHVELFRHMFLHDRLGARLLGATSLREVYDLLHGYPLMGDFMSYQITIDLNYSALIGFSENDFTQAGPGALRGIRKVFEDLGDFTPTEVVLWMTDHQDEEFARLGLPFTGLWGRPLHAIDCQGLFCETDKYCRQAAPELASTRKRIKARFTPTPEPISLFFPPKWGINNKLPAIPAAGGGKPTGDAQEALF